MALGLLNIDCSSKLGPDDDSTAREELSALPLILEGRGVDEDDIVETSLAVKLSGRRGG